MPQTLDDLTSEEFDQLIERYIERSAEWDGVLPLDTMLETWAEMEALATGCKKSRSVLKLVQFLAECY